MVVSVVVVLRWKEEGELSTSWSCACSHKTARVARRRPHGANENWGRLAKVRAVGEGLQPPS